MKTERECVALLLVALVAAGGVWFGTSGDSRGPLALVLVAVAVVAYGRWWQLHRRGAPRA